MAPRTKWNISLSINKTVDMYSTNLLGNHLHSASKAFPRRDVFRNVFLCSAVGDYFEMYNLCAAECKEHTINNGNAIGNRHYSESFSLPPSRLCVSNDSNR